MAIALLNDEQRPLIRTNNPRPAIRPDDFLPNNLSKYAVPRLILLASTASILLLFFVSSFTTPSLRLTSLSLPTLKKSAPLNSDGLPLQTSLSFIAIGDWGRKGHHHQRQVSNAMSKVISRLENTLNFVVSTGDNFYDNGVEGIGDKQWNKSFEHVYNQKSFQGLPWYAILGNHDHLGDIHAQIKYGKENGRWNMPATYYDKLFRLPRRDGKMEKIHFVFLDTTPYVKDGYGKEARKKNGQKPDVQTAWFRKVMADYKAEKVVVILHHQMYTMSIAGHLGTREVRAAFEPILLEYRHRVLAVISGHEHLLEHLQPYGGYNQWKGLAGRMAFLEDLNVVERMKRTVGWKRRNKVIDYFISGGGSQLDKLKRPKKRVQSVWRDCCSVLPLSKEKTKPRAVYGARTHGFFVFAITENEFYAKAYDENAQVVYEYSKPI